MASQGRVLPWAAQPLEAAERTIARGGSVPEPRARRSQTAGARAVALRACLLQLDSLLGCRSEAGNRVKPGAGVSRTIWDGSWVRRVSWFRHC